MLIFKYEVSNFGGQTITLPSALPAANLLTLARRYSRAHGLNRIGCRAKIVRGNVGDGPGLPGSIGGKSGGTVQVSCGTHGAATCGTRLHHAKLAAHPSANGGDGVARAQIGGRAESNKGKTCSAHSAAHSASKW